MVDIETIRSHFINHGITFGEYAPGHAIRIMVDPRQALLSGGILSDVGELMWERIKKYDPTVIYGTGFGSLNLLLTVQIAAEKDGVNLKTLVSRSQRKDTNMRRLVEGPRPNDFERAVYIDDNMNSGITYHKTQADLAEEGIKLNTVAVALFYDFWTFKGSRRLELLGIPVERIFKRHDIGDTRIDPGPSVTENISWRNLAHNQWNNKWLNTAPLIVGNKVYYGNDRHQLYCHNLDAGDIYWSYQGDKPTVAKGLSCQIRYSNGYIYLGSYDGTLTKLDAETGVVVWKKHLDMFIHSTPYVDEDRNYVYIGTEGGIRNQRGDIVCLDSITGTTIWVQPTNDVIPASPMLVNNQVICGSNDGNLYSVNPDTGKLNWVIRGFGVVKGRVNYIDDVIIACSEKGKITGIDSNGKVLWTRSCGKNSYHQMLEVHRDLGLVYVVNSDGMAIAFNKNGEQIWLRRVRGDGNCNLTLRGNEIIIITITGHISLLDPATGEKLRSNQLNISARCPCDFNDNYIAVNTTRKGFYIYRRDHAQISD